MTTTRLSWLHAAAALVLGAGLIGIGETIRRWEKRACEFANVTDQGDA